METKAVYFCVEVTIQKLLAIAISYQQSWWIENCQSPQISKLSTCTLIEPLTIPCHPSTYQNLIMLQSTMPLVPFGNITLQSSRSYSVRIPWALDMRSSYERLGNSRCSHTSLSQALSPTWPIEPVTQHAHFCMQTTTEQNYKLIKQSSLVLYSIVSLHMICQQARCLFRVDYTPSPSYQYRTSDLMQSGI